MIYRCCATTTTGRQCAHKARPGESACTRHLDKSNPVQYHRQTSGKRIRIGRTRVRPLDRKPTMFG